MRAFALVALAAMMGCSSRALVAGDGGSRDHGAIADPAACGCQLDPVTHVLTMSWDCYCQTHDCARFMATACTSGAWTRGCGLTQYSSVEGGFGSERLAYDESHHLVGVQSSTDYYAYSCPTDPSLRSYAVQAGTLLDNCSGATTCQCDADGGTCYPTDAELPAGSGGAPGDRG